MFYKKKIRGKVVLDFNQAAFLVYVVGALRKKLRITGKLVPSFMYQEQLLDEYEELELQLEDKQILEVLENYEIEQDISLSRPNKKQRLKIKNGNTSHNT